MSSNSKPGSRVLVEPKQAERFEMLPQAAKRFLALPPLNGQKHFIYCGEYAANFAVTPAVLANGPPPSISVTARLVDTLEPEVARLHAEGRPICLVSAEVTNTDTTALGVPVAWRLDVQHKRYDLPTLDHAPFHPDSHIVRTYVTDARIKSSKHREPILSEPLVYADKTYDSVSFCAFSAWGFRSEDLKNVAKPCGIDRLFLPSTYRYSELIARVHSAISLANARNHANALYAESMPEGVFKLSGTRAGYEIAKKDLDAAIEYIEQRLVPSLVLFDPQYLPLVVRPFGAANWTEVYAQHLTVQRTSDAIQLPPTDPNPKEMQASLRIIAHFCILDQDSLTTMQDDGQVVRQLPSGVSALAKRNDDDDGTE